jgi:hypothetical protein
MFAKGYSASAIRGWPEIGRRSDGVFAVSSHFEALRIGFLGHPGATLLRQDTGCPASRPDVSSLARKRHQVIPVQVSS